LAMRVCTPPTNFPPMKTAGTGCWTPASWWRTDRIPAPLACSSSSTTMGPTPRLKRRRLATVDMQQSVTLKTTTALHETKWCTIS
ncbi:hypothetical protein VIGAN_02287600, partial [Vigna angularis var. angularis]